MRSSEGAEKEKLEKQLEEHHKLAESAFTMRRDDKARAVRSWVGKPRPVGSSGVKHRSKDAVDMITYDFQQNLETPNLQHTDMFYKRQLWNLQLWYPRLCVQPGLYVYVGRDDSQTLVSGGGKLPV